MASQHLFTCTCGQVALQASGAPITGVACDCSHCVAATQAFAAMGAPDDSRGFPGARAVLFRNDRVRLLRGRDRLDQYRFGSDAPTRRIVARCCATPMLLDYQAGFWLSLYRDRSDIDEGRVPSRPPGFGFIARLMRSFALGAFRVPKSDPTLADLPEHHLAPPA